MMSTIKGNVSTVVNFDNITKTRPCNIQRFFKGLKITIFSLIFLIFFIFLLKTYIVGTR